MMQCNTCIPERINIDDAVQHLHYREDKYIDDEVQHLHYREDINIDYAAKQVI